ncbi:unnamed protein product [Protopolystoma xenopodis]|uniref:Uncharacterized protein n=1 Tax=Protopolystoma xenopodis TaxID=117903 RepID=A0A3S5FDX1_9PLAT|nr:unnamed protein product [Protopolystoma xenopodis]
MSNSKDEIRISSKVHDTGLSNSLSAFEDKPDWFEKPSEQQQRTGRKDSPYFTLLHGAATRQPTLLLPFFCLQVFDFIVAILSIVGLMSSKPDICIWFRLKSLFFI